MVLHIHYRSILVLLNFLLAQILEILGLARQVFELPLRELLINDAIVVLAVHHIRAVGVDILARRLIIPMLDLLRFAVLIFVHLVSRSLRRILEHLCISRIQRF